ncbi:MAG TPA: hypothetical protein DCZ01_02835 [Elusimicrobia bacterium]|nr:MAG: hypothetical protein A2X37_05465 [Elusimicrobia bacterium GWA2_66_18]OGR69179.1 MAG: hypothetical protein A2X40_07185 [Elusimicrobia bacterium GWC2_65_9]HAZ07466.1 hypothetical protein [Elusimicrobiota bacterium]
MADSYLLVTGDGCFKAGEELLRLVTGLPRRGAPADFQRALAELDSPGAFATLVANGTLTPENTRPLHRRIFSALLQPRLTLLKPLVQERAFRRLGLDPERCGSKAFALNGLLAASGAALSAAVWLLAPRPAALHGGTGAATVLLALAGMIVHELGHSASTWALGLGARPIGLSLYLYCPVFYTNVSGIRSLDLRGQIAVSLGGFSAQTLYMLGLEAAFLATGQDALLLALQALSGLLIFNLNPLLHTDGYWCYHDIYERFQERRWVRALHTAYLAAFSGYTVYLVWRGGLFLSAALRRFLADGRLCAGEGVRLLFCGYLGVMLAQGVRARMGEVLKR